MTLEKLKTFVNVIFVAKPAIFAKSPSIYIFYAIILNEILWLEL